MARIRTIKPEFAQSESIGRVSREARLFFILLWTICDDTGVTRGSSRMLASLLYPYDEDAPSLLRGWVEELHAEGCITQYEVDGSTYIKVNKWADHQRIDRPTASRFPQPPSGLVEPSSKPREPSTHPREHSRALDEPSSLEGKGVDQGPRTKERKGVTAAFLMDKFVNAMKITHEQLLRAGQGWISFAGTYDEWLKLGCTEEDIWPTIERVGIPFIAKHGQPPKAPMYFSKAILEARDFRLAMPAPAPKAERIPVPGRAGTTTPGMLDTVVRLYIDGGTWEMSLSEALPFMPEFTFPEPWCSQLKEAPIPRSLKLFYLTDNSTRPSERDARPILEAHRKALNLVEA